MGTYKMNISGGLKYVDCNHELKKRVGMELGSVTERHLHIDDGFSIIAMDGEKIAGIIAVCEKLLPPPLRETYEGFIDIIEVPQEYRRKGVARKPVETAMERCRKAGYYQLLAWSSDNKTEAISMWKAVGFALAPASIFPAGAEIKGYFAAYRL